MMRTLKILIQSLLLHFIVNENAKYQFNPRRAIHDCNVKMTFFMKFTLFWMKFIMIIEKIDLDVFKYIKKRDIVAIKRCLLLF